MTRVDKNRLKGNYAENIVAAWLSRSCLVHPVAEGTDIGVDLYCESVIDSTPYLHFWAQVKAVNSSHIRTIDGKEEAWFDFDVKHLQYWARQPIPVYAFLVPIDEWPPSEPKRIYGIKITEFVVKNEIKDEGTIRLTSGGWWDASSIDEDIHQFITKIVSWNASANLVQRGIIAPIQTAQKESQERFPSGIGFRHLEKILDNIRDASVMGLMDSIAFERVDPTKKHIKKEIRTCTKSLCRTIA